MTRRPWEVRRSPRHGRGVFAIATIPEGTRIIEYTGELISEAEGERRYPTPPDGHDDYPDVIIRMNHVDFAHFGRHTVTFGGTATLESEQITVRVTAVDAGNRDRFSITARDLDGNVVFHLPKALTSGDIASR